jgi:hypothetical protein
VVTNLGQKAYVLHNDTGGHNGGIGIRTLGRKSKRDGIGCRVKVVTASGAAQYYTVNTAAGYLSASDKRVIAGLGAGRSAKLVEIRWPSDAVQRFTDIRSGMTIDAVEPAP